MLKKKYTLDEIRMAMAEATTKMLQELKEADKEEDSEEEPIAPHEMISMVMGYAMYSAEVLKSLQEL